MKKEELVGLLNGLDNAEEVVEFILAENAIEVEEARKGDKSWKESTELQTALETSNKELAEAKTELAKYAKDGEMYIDPEEFARLKSFETETADKERAKQRLEAVNALFENHGVP